MRPLGELDLRDELRLNPRDVGPAHARHLRHLGEWTVRAPERSEQSQQPRDLAVREARPDVSGPPKHTCVVYSDDERAEPSRASSLPARVPGDHDLLRPTQLELVPVRRATSGLVRRVGLLGDDALELLVASGCEQGGTVVELRRDEDLAAGADDALELLSAFGQRLVDDGDRVDLQHVEENEHDRSTALLEEREA